MRSSSEIIDSRSKQLVRRFSPLNAHEKLHGCGEAIQIPLPRSLSNVDSCLDNDGNCPAMKKNGACQSHPDVIKTWCLYSCNLCNGELYTELSCD